MKLYVEKNTLYMELFELHAKCRHDNSDKVIDEPYRQRAPAEPGVDRTIIIQLERLEKQLVETRTTIREQTELISQYKVTIKELTTSHYESEKHTKILIKSVEDKYQEAIILLR